MSRPCAAPALCLPLVRPRLGPLHPPARCAAQVLDFFAGGGLPPALTATAFVGAMAGLLLLGGTGAADKLNQVGGAAEGRGGGRAGAPPHYLCAATGSGELLFSGRKG